MLLKFSVKNYKSFYEEAVFSMMPAPRQKGLDYSILEEQIGTKKYKGLCSAVIYGPNASGKTNLIAAMDTLKAIISRGHVRNVDEFSFPNIAASSLELIPNCNHDPTPTTFSIKFTDSGMLFEYILSVDLGKFDEPVGTHRILFERLSVNGRTAFTRRETVALTFPSFLKSYRNSSSQNEAQKALDDAATYIANDSLTSDELFLCNGFRTIFYQDLANIITKWFSNRFFVYCRSDALRFYKASPSKDISMVDMDNTLFAAAKEFGVTANLMGYRRNEDTGTATLYSILNKNMLPAEIFESFGTVRFVNIFPSIITAFRTGATLVLDEFDASIHPMAVMSIIKAFHNDEINKKHAQLIFNTHNPIFLNSGLFRRDEIKFVEREANGESIHYSLSDFKTTDGVRNGESYMKNYFVSRYGAIKDVDFAPILKDLMNQVDRDEASEK